MFLEKAMEGEDSQAMQERNGINNRIAMDPCNGSMQWIHAMDSTVLLVCSSKFGCINNIIILFVPSTRSRALWASMHATLACSMF